MLYKNKYRLSQNKSGKTAQLNNATWSYLILLPDSIQSLQYRMQPVRLFKLHFVFTKHLRTNTLYKIMNNYTEKSDKRCAESKS